MSLADVYASAVHDNLHLFANWPIGTERKLGDVGYLEGNRFVKEANVFDEDRFGIALEPRNSPADIVFRFTSAGVSVAQIDLAGGTTDPAAGVTANAGVTIQFEKGESVYFRSIKLKHSCIQNSKAVNDAILKAFAEGSWDSRTVVVSSIFESDGTTILVSSNAGASIQIEGSAGSALPFDLADANAGLSVRRERDIGVTAIAAQGLTPLMSLSQVRPTNRWLAWLRLSELSVRPLATGQDLEPNFAEMIESGRGAIQGQFSPQLAEELDRSVEEVFQVVELE